MKPEQFLLFLTLFVIVYINTTTLPQAKADIYFPLQAEGMVAMQIATTEPSVFKPLTECNCGGDGKVSTPDGQSTMPCQCGSDCNCKSNKEPDPVKRVCPKCGREDCPGARSTALHYEPIPFVSSTLEVNPPFPRTNIVNENLDQQIIWFTQPNCPPCTSFKKDEIPKLEELNWICSTDSKAHIREIDAKAHEDVYRKYVNGLGTPCFVKLRRGKVIKIIEGSLTAKQVTDLWYEK